MGSVRRLIDGLVDARLPEVPDAKLTVAERLAAVSRHGDFSLAYSAAIQEGLSRFGGPDGYIAYAAKMGTIYALGDPVAPPQERDGLIRRFVAAAGRPCFVQIEEPTARTLASLGYRVNLMGYDTRLDLSKDPFTGKRTETVRYSERWLFKKGYRIEDTGTGDGLAADIAELSRRWRDQKIVRRREMTFLNRPFEDVGTPGTRRFVLFDPENRPTAVLGFDPLYRDSRLIGYTTFFKRKLPGTTAHAEIGLTKHAADRFRAEGLETMTLGLSPMAGITASGYRETVILREFLKWAHDSELINAKIFNIKGQAAFRSRFHGERSPFYIAFGKGMVFAQLIGFLRVCKAI